MSALVPAPTTLGLGTPALGPWFDPDVTLPAPATDLSVAVTIPSGTTWLPATTGTFHLAVMGDPVPPRLATVRGVDGAVPFTSGRVVAIFRFLPEARERLHALQASLPSPDGIAPTAGTPTRPAAAALALELPAGVTVAQLLSWVRPVALDAAELGLAGAANDAPSNGDTEMVDLLRPGVAGQPLTTRREELLVVDQALPCRLFALDDRGDLLDPGAVAAWWTSLATTSTNLFAPGLTGTAQRVATSAPHLGVRLVGPHGGAADADALGRLATTNLSGTGTDAVRERTAAATGAATFAVTAGTAAAAPVPLVALHPHGAFATTLSLWATGPVGGLPRDHVRVGVVDVERHLVGQPRTSTATGTDDAAVAATRRAADQARASTGVRVARSSGLGILPTGETALAAFANVLDRTVGGAGPVTMVAEVAEAAAGPFPVPTLPDVAPPTSLPELEVSGLVGGGSLDATDIARDQRVLVELALDAGLAGAWVRCWTQEVALDDTHGPTGRRLRGDGGAGLVRADGTVSLVVPLPDGPVTTAASPGLDVLVVTGRGARLFPDQRFTRPAPEGGAAVDLAAATGELVVCETGLATTPLSPGDVPPGATVVARMDDDDPAALVEPPTLASVGITQRLDQLLVAGDTVQLSEPAWAAARTGDAPEALAGGGANVAEHVRSGLARLVAAGAPLPTQSRLDHVAVRLSATAAAGAMSGLPLLSHRHELGRHQDGHAGAPADREHHGVGVDLAGPAVAALAEYVRERTAGDTAALAAAAATPLATPPAVPGPSHWAAVLRTVAAGVEAEPALADVVDLVGDPYPFGDDLTAVTTWLTARGIAVPPVVGAAAASVARALDRRLLAAGRGLTEGATALAAALGRAEDLVLVETPALDVLGAGPAHDRVDPLAALVERLALRPRLHVVLCLPDRFDPATPRSLRRVRDRLAREAVAALLAAAPGRVAAFTPWTGPGRSLRVVTTTVVVDDAWAMVGTTHPWRRGLSFDGSLAVSLFDDQLDDGRPAHLVAARRALVAGRLGINVTEVPEEPAALVAAVRRLTRNGGTQRVAVAPIPGDPDVDPGVTGTDADVWNPDGSPGTGNAMDVLFGLTAAAQAEVLGELPPT